MPIIRVDKEVYRHVRTLDDSLAPGTGSHSPEGRPESPAGLQPSQKPPQVHQKALPAYSHPKSPHKFTQHQLFACLALKQFLHTNFRSLEVTLTEWSDLREVLGLKEVPHYSTFCYARRRLLKKGLSISSSPPC